MKYLLDTDHCIALTKRDPAILGALRKHPPSQVRASSISLAELSYGAAKSTQPKEAAANIRRVLKTLVIVPFDEAAADAYGGIRAALEKRGAPIGPHDTLIAAQALSLGWTLVTHNTREFKRVTGLPVEDWLASKA